LFKNPERSKRPIGTNPTPRDALIAIANKKPSSTPQS
jgi:hypothetical protein